MQNWIPDTGRVAGFPVHVGADRVRVLPPFGCMIEGWVLSPLKPIQPFIPRIGSCVLHSDPLASAIKARTDLADAFPNYRQLCASAFPSRVHGGVAGPVATGRSQPAGVTGRQEGLRLRQTRSALPKGQTRPVTLPA